MNIFLREFRANLKSLLIYAVIIFLFTVTGFAKFKAYAENPQMLEALTQLPRAVLEALNMNFFNLTRLSGFYGIMHVYYALILAIAAVMWGSEVISKEERDKTVEFLLALPVRRGRVVTAKLLAMVVHSILLLVITALSVLFSVRSYPADEGFWPFFSRSLAGLFLLQMIFLTLGIFLAAVIRQYRRLGSTALAILFATYFLSIFSALHEKMDFLKYFSPFKYVDAGMLWRAQRIEPVYLWLSLGLILLFVSTAYWAYQRRDLSI